MADLTTIVSRDAFADVLARAAARTRQLAAGNWRLILEIQRQLEFVARTTADGREPTDQERERTSLGPLAARNLETYDPHYAHQLKQLDYTFRRYPALPAGPPVLRHAILQVWSGPDTFAKLLVPPDCARSIGSGGAQLEVGGDATLAGPHFELLWDGVSGHVRPLGRQRITVDGRPAFRGELAHRGWMTAGHTTFRFLVEAHTPPRTPPRATPGGQAARDLLDPLRARGRLYAIVDAARSDRALQLVEESIDPYASLYDGERGRAFDDVAPYLVQLRRDSGLLGRLIDEGWGEAWGVYLASDAGFDAVRRHLRQFLKVDVEGEPHPLFFRFYDPRVLRTFADVIQPDQRAALLAKIDGITYERADGTPATLARA